MEKIVKVSANCLKLLEEFECSGDFRLYLKSYRCPAGKWTIGMGTTRYPSGKPVGPGEVITEQQVFELVTHDIARVESALARLVTSDIRQHQFDALADFIYNLGQTAFANSTLLKVVNNNPHDPMVQKQFMRWINAGGKPQGGLIRRRRAEFWLYSTGQLRFNFQS